MNNSQSEKPQDSVTERFPQFCKIYLQELDWVLTVSMGEKSRHASNRVRRKQPFQNMPECSVLDEACLRRHQLTSAQPAGC